MLGGPEVRDPPSEPARLGSPVIHEIMGRWGEVGGGGVVKRPHPSHFLHVCSVLLRSFHVSSLLSIVSLCGTLVVPRGRLAELVLASPSSLQTLRGWPVVAVNSPWGRHLDLALAATTISPR